MPALRYAPIAMFGLSFVAPAPLSMNWVGLRHGAAGTHTQAPYVDRMVAEALILPPEPPNQQNCRNNARIRARELKPPCHGCACLAAAQSGSPQRMALGVVDAACSGVGLRGLTRYG
jgi:hypothetical protein